MPAMRAALYPGSFDPVTFGHLDVIRRAAALADRLVVAVGVHHSKSGLFPPAERVELLQAALAGVPGRIEVTTFDGLVVDAARAAGAKVIMRGIRNGADLDYETQMAGMNRALDPGLEYVFLAAAPETAHIAASFVRQIAALGGSVDAFVPPHVAERLRALRPGA
jgi:pantetheine-phosphate adenylyltransferase